MNWKLAVLGAVLIGCQSSPETSFRNLNKAFISWYFKYHPIESTRYGMKDNYGNFREISISGRDEYSADISRFLIELSQIDATKIFPEARIDYNILYSKLDQMKLLMEGIKPWEWNPLWTLNEISTGFYILSEREQIDMEDRVEAVQSRLVQLPQLLNNSKDMLTAYSMLHTQHSMEGIEKLIHLLQQLPLKLNSDNMTLDKIDRLIEKAISALKSYKDWLMNDLTAMEVKNIPVSLQLIDKGFTIYTGGEYIPASVYKLAEKKLTPAQNRLFYLSLPFYLKENDEPVWLDRDNTLEVIQWTIGNMRIDLSSVVPNDEVLSTFYESLTNLEQFIYNHSLFPEKINKTIQLDFAPEYSFSNAPVFLFNHHPKDSMTVAVYSIMAAGDIDEKYILSRKEIDLINAKLIIPGSGVQIAYAQRYPSTIRYIFPDPVTSAGWKAYAAAMLLDSGFGDCDEEYRILKLKEEIAIISNAIVEGSYYSGDLSRLDAIKFYRKNAFMNEREAEIVQLETDFNYFSGTQSFIGMMELKSLLAAYKKRMGEEFQISEFHRIILQDGIIPLHELKKEVFSL